MSEDLQEGHVTGKGRPQTHVLRGGTVHNADPSRTGGRKTPWRGRLARRFSGRVFEGPSVIFSLLGLNVRREARLQKCLNRKKPGVVKENGSSFPTSPHGKVLSSYES